MAAYSGFVRSHLELFTDLPGIITIPAGNAIAQPLLDQIVEAIYSRTLTLTTHTVEVVLRAVHYLDIPVIEEACGSYCINNAAAIAAQVSALDKNNTPAAFLDPS